MAEEQVAADDAVRDLVRWLASLTWPMDQPRVVELATQRGWTLEDEDDAGVDWQTGLISDRSHASATVLEGFVESVRVTTARVPNEEPDSKRVIRDAFTAQVASVTDELGAPRSRRPGRAPQVEWDLASGAALTVIAVERSCGWHLTSPKFVEIERELARRGG